MFDNPTERYSENYSIGLNDEISHVKGSCKSFETLDEATAFITSKNAEKVFEEKGELYDCEYYYSSEISAFVLVEGKKVNIHLSKVGDIKIGVPFIFGSY